MKKKVLKNELKEAAELCQDVMASNPLNAEPYHLYALILLRQNKLQEAGKNILEAITRNDTVRLQFSVTGFQPALLTTVGLGILVLNNT